MLGSRAVHRWPRVWLELAGGYALLVLALAVTDQAEAEVFSSAPGRVLLVVAVLIVMGVAVWIAQERRSATRISFAALAAFVVGALLLRLTRPGLSEMPSEWWVPVGVLAVLVMWSATLAAVLALRQSRRFALAALAGLLAVTGPVGYIAMAWHSRPPDELELQMALRLVMIPLATQMTISFVAVWVATVAANLLPSRRQVVPQEASRLRDEG